MDFSVYIDHWRPRILTMYQWKIKDSVREFCPELSYIVEIMYLLCIIWFVWESNKIMFPELNSNHQDSTISLCSYSPGPAVFFGKYSISLLGFAFSIISVMNIFASSRHVSLFYISFKYLHKRTFRTFFPWVLRKLPATAHALPWYWGDIQNPPT